MAEYKHMTLVRQGAPSLAEWVAQNPDVCLDFQDADFTGWDFTGFHFERANFANANLSRAMLTGTQFHNCDLTGVRFCDAQSEQSRYKLELFECKLNQADFRNADLQHITLKNMEADSVNFQNAQLNGAIFQDVKLKDSNFDGCDLTKTSADSLTLDNCSIRDANLSKVTLMTVTLRKCNFQGANFFEATFSHGEWLETRGLTRAKNVETVRTESAEPKYIGDSPLPWWERNCDWESLRKFGRLPLFGLSYSVLVLIPSYIFVLTWFNAQVEKLRTWQGSSGDWFGRYLHPLPMPSLSLLLLVSTLLLAIASTIYALACPSRIKEFTRDVWCDQFNRSILHYWPFAWKHRVLRLICFFCYVAGGLGAIYVLIVKVVKAGSYIVTHTSI